MPSGEAPGSVPHARPPAAGGGAAAPGSAAGPCALPPGSRGYIPSPGPTRGHNGIATEWLEEEGPPECVSHHFGRLLPDSRLGFTCRLGLRVRALGSGGTSPPHGMAAACILGTGRRLGRGLPPGGLPPLRSFKFPFPPPTASLGLPPRCCQVTYMIGAVVGG